jgi:hypothetical protein
MEGKKKGGLSNINHSSLAELQAPELWQLKAQAEVKGLILL